MEELLSRRQRDEDDAQQVVKKERRRIIKAATRIAKLAKDVLVKALGRKKGNNQFGSEKHGESPFT